MNTYLLKALFLKSPQHESPDKVESVKDKLKILNKREPFKLSRVLCTFLRSQKEKKMIDYGLKRIDRELEIVRFLRAQM